MSYNRSSQLRVRSATGRCVAQLPTGANPLFDACAKGTAFKNDGKTPIGKPAMSFSVTIPGTGGGAVGVCCADYSDILSSAVTAKNTVAPIVCGIDMLRNLIPETVPLPIKLPGNPPPSVGFPARQFFCPQPGVPPFEPPPTAAALPPTEPQDVPWRRAR